MANDQDIVLESLRYVAALKDPMSFINDGEITNNSNSNNKKDKDEQQIYAWRMFLAVMEVLKQFEAITVINEPSSSTADTVATAGNNNNNNNNNNNSNNNNSNNNSSSNSSSNSSNANTNVIQPTELGQLVGSLSADNELWLAIVLKQPQVAELSPGTHTPNHIMSFLIVYDVYVVDVVDECVDMEWAIAKPRFCSIIHPIR